MKHVRYFINIIDNGNSKMVEGGLGLDIIPVGATCFHMRKELGQSIY